MCGIFAAVNSKYVLNNSFNKLSHRGPDYSILTQVSTKPEIVMGFHHLSIMGGRQPFYYNDCWLIANAEIFNYIELQRKYDITMNTVSDCEIIIHMYKYFGRGKNGMVKTILSLNAEFSFILYDTLNNTLYIARDTYGVRPLFYSDNIQSFHFASEMKGLEPRFSSVKPFPPGCLMELNTDSLEKTVYPLCDEYNLHLNLLLTNAVQSRLMSNVPLGCYLSGGLDSSIITCIVSKFLQSQGKRLECFTIGLDDTSQDIQNAKKVASHLGNVNHHVVHFTIEEGWQAICDVIYTLETYDITTIRASVPQYLLSKYIREKTDIKVLLSGEGSDELFAGYKYFQLAPNLKELALETKRLLNDLYMFDNLRTDRTSSAFGLEVRAPFLDIQLINYVLQSPTHLRDPRRVIEKKWLREAFKDDLPEEVYARKKEAFSDAVSSSSQSWYIGLADKIKEKLESEGPLKESENFPSLEAFYYYTIFQSFFPNQEKCISYYWMPKWCDVKDPSATVLNISTK